MEQDGRNNHKEYTEDRDVRTRLISEVKQTCLVEQVKLHAKIFQV